MEREVFESREVELADGQHIVTRIFRPTGARRGAVLIVAAMGVTQAFYAPLAKWLAGVGFVALTFDYRGMGLSRPVEHRRSLRGFEVGLLDWARQDCAAMLDLASNEAPGAPISWLGHSLGGQILPFVPNRESVAPMITVASGSGYWRENSPRLRRFAGLLWYGVVPASMALFGYFPGKRLRMVGDLPRGVMAQWRRWCLDPISGDLARQEATRSMQSVSRVSSLDGFSRGSPRRSSRSPSPTTTSCPRATRSRCTASMPAHRAP